MVPDLETTIPVAISPVEAFYVVPFPFSWIRPPKNQRSRGHLLWLRPLLRPRRHLAPARRPRSNSNNMWRYSDRRHKQLFLSAATASRFLLHQMLCLQFSSDDSASGVNLSNWFRLLGQQIYSFKRRGRTLPLSDKRLLFHPSKRYGVTAFSYKRGCDSASLPIFL